MSEEEFIATKKCPHCQQWSVWQQQPDDRCQHCGQLLDPRTHAEEAGREAAGPPPPAGLRWLQIQPDDGAAVRFLKTIGQGGQWLFAAVVGFFVWLVTMMAA